MTPRNSKHSGTVTAVYTRVSEDRENLELGVERQRDECVELCRHRGWPDPVLFEDNDISASTGKTRPGYAALMAAVARGEVARVVVFHPSRIWRNRRERADGIEVASDVPSVAGFLARAKVAVAPLRIGTGVPNKVLEAARAGAAVVLTPEANAGLGFSERAVAVAASTSAFVTEIEQLLGSADRRRNQVVAAAGELARFDLTSVARRYEEALTSAVAGRAGSGRRCAS